MSAPSFDVEAVRKDFPVLSREVNGRPLVYLDSASSSHKPRQVLEAERQFVEEHYSNVHRGVHTLSQEATDAYESARSTVAGFIGGAPREVPPQRFDGLITENRRPLIQRPLRQAGILILSRC